MANTKKTKELTPIGTLASNIIADYSFEEKLHLLEVLREHITIESESMKKKLQLAESTLNNGK